MYLALGNRIYRGFCNQEVAVFDGCDSWIKGPLCKQIYSSVAFPAIDGFSVHNLYY